MLKTLRWIAGAVLGLVLAGVAQAALQARDLDGNGQTDAYYDTELNITWLRDWNYAMTSGYDADGWMTWAQAKTWATNLAFGGYADWRLPTMVETGAVGCDFSYAGGTDCGYSVQTKTGSTVYSEMAHLFYVTLGSEGYCKPAPDSTTSSCAVDSNWSSDPQADYLAATGTYPFLNMLTYWYWSGLEYQGSSVGLRAWGFNFSNGYQDSHDHLNLFGAVAVRTGDVAASVPEPQALALALLGLTALAAARRRRAR